MNINNENINKQQQGLAATRENAENMFTTENEELHNSNQF